ncbi:MAG TPA: hypothetical protein VGU71_22285 [Candidatus Dormibacteraeota bacterium]|nr:hypothetical protein [Candidatus Dormibacteraeota bacterium]
MQRRELIRIVSIDLSRYAIVDGQLVRKISGGMPIEPSFMKNEPSMGPVPAQTISPTSTLTGSETTGGLEIKPIPGELITVPLFATTVSQTIFTADNASYQIVAVTAVPNVIGGAGATVTVEALTGVQAPGAGVAQLTAALALNGVAHTVLTGNLVAAPTTITQGQRFGLVMAGTLTGLVGVLVVTIKRV